MSAPSSKSTMNRNIHSIRSDFPILDQEVNGYPLIYLDNAATTQKPSSVIDAIAEYYRNDNANVHRGVHTLSNRATEAYEASRRRTATFLNAATHREIVFTSGTTDGINLVARAWGERFLEPGDRIALTEMEHHSNLVPWQMLCERVGAELVFIPALDNGAGLDLSGLEEILSDRVKLFAFTHVSNTMGVVNPVAQMCDIARSCGVVTLVDGAQSAGHMPVDVNALGCDFYAFSAHKALGPTGFGALYGREAALESMDPYKGGGEMIREVRFDGFTSNELPHKFEAGTPNMAGAVGWSAAMDYLESLGRDAVFDHDQELAQFAYKALSEVEGAHIYGPSGVRSAAVSFRVAGLHSHDLVSLADARGVALRGGHHCNQPLMGKLGVETTARMSFYVYNTREDVSRAVEIIDDISRRFAER